MYKKNYNEIGREKLIEYKKKQIKSLLSILNKCKISSDNHNSTSVPFFARSQNIEDFIINNNKINNNIPERLNRNIKLIYELLGDNEKEIYIGDWTLMSINEAVKIYENYCSHGQKNIFDIGYRYIGMGHIEVISCDLNSHLLFYRPDGGSNGWDREANFNKVINKGSKDYEQFYFSKWFYNALNKYSESI